MIASPRELLARLTDRQRRRIGLGVLGAIAVFVLADLAIAISSANLAGVAETLVLGITFLAVLALSIRAQPSNAAVWTLVWAAFFGVLGQLAGSIGGARSDFTFAAIENGEVGVAPSSIEPLAAVGFSIASVGWLPGVFLLAIHLLILFPDGRARSAWWRRVAWATAVMLAIMVVAGLVNTAPWVDKPYDEIFANDMSPGLLSVLMVPLMAGALASVVHLIRRYRKSSGEERLQYRWVTWALAIFVVNIFAFGWLPGALGPVVSTLALANIAVAFGIAITRYGLYSIDIVISRSITYGVLAVFIGGVYIALVVGIGAVLGGDSSFVPSLAATVVVAIVFEPGRRRMGQWANRLVYGKRATPYEVLVRFSRRSSELSDEELLQRIPHLIADGTGASEATLWVKTDGGFRTASAWPEDTAARSIDGSDQFVDPDAGHSLPVFHDRELLGGISLTKERGERLTPIEETLLQDLAAGMGLALRNARLTGQLRQQVADLEASRERVLVAADAARRALERDLDSGPQQQLVALKVKLGPTRKLAEQLGAEKTAALLAQLEGETGDAIQAVRDFAGGIYPPLLEAEGLAVAIAQQAHKAAIPISVDSEGLGRYPRDTEAAVYFTVMEALQNTTKYAEADSASVTLAADGGRLQFEVRDDGRGFDVASVTAGAGLAGMTDRMDTVGGEVRIDSEPGSGTVVLGSVPIDELVPA